jgi:putative transcriptional regulator
MKNRVRELRKNKKLTQEELAELIGISRQAINAIEKEKFDPSLPTAFKMAELFKTSIEELFLFTIIKNKNY